MDIIHESVQKLCEERDEEAIAQARKDYYEKIAQARVDFETEVIRAGGTEEDLSLEE